MFQGMDKSTVHCASSTQKATLFCLNSASAQLPATEMFNPLSAKYFFVFQTVFMRNWVCRYTAEKYSHPRCLVHEFHEFINRKKIMTQNIRWSWCVWACVWYWYHSQINQSKMASTIVTSTTATTTSTTTTPEMNDKCSQFQFVYDLMV